MVCTQEIVTTAVNGMTDDLSYIVSSFPSCMMHFERDIAFRFLFQKIEVTDLFPS